MILGGGNNSNMMQDSANNKTMSADLDDLNRTLYDIGAQDLLDVWEAMEAQNEGNGGQNGGWQNGGLFSGGVDGLLLPTPVLKDRLLTDSVVQNGGEEFPVAAEHSYSIGNNNSGSGGGGGGGGTNSISSFGSGSSDGGCDAESMPESPHSSLDDDMETECYPCIPMHSASNQKRLANAIDVSMIKKERPMSPDEDFNVVVDDDDHFRGRRQINGVSQMSHLASGTSLLQRPTSAASRRSKNNSNKSAATTSSGLRMQQHTVRLTRPKHPQSLLKQQPVTHTILVTTAASTLSQAASAASGTDPSLGGLIKTEPSMESLISNQPTDGSGELILTEEEKKTLISEGYPIPSKLPLTKAEEKSLKKIRRKIKNKISAQESRRKKKEFVDTLERKVELAIQELDEYKKKCELLQKQNSSLTTQLKSLRAIVQASATNNNTSSQQQQLFKLDPDALESIFETGFDLD